MEKIDTSPAALRALAKKLLGIDEKGYFAWARAADALYAVADEKETALEKLTRIDLAKNMPHVLPQWQEWQAAEDALKLAKQMRDIAHAKWVKVRDGK